MVCSACVMFLGLRFERKGETTWKISSEVARRILIVPGFACVFGLFSKTAFLFWLTAFQLGCFRKALHASLRFVPFAHVCFCQ